MSRKTVLVVDDDPGTLHVLSDGLANVLESVDVVTACNGREAIDVLESRTVDVLVTDLSMPILDGFSLIAAVNNRYASLPVVVLSGMARADIDPPLARYRDLRVLRKPSSYHTLAQAVTEALERVEMGQVEGIPLAAVLQLVEAERRSCTLRVVSGRRKGRLEFLSGVLVNAFSDDFGVDGEAAAHDILTWPDTEIEFDHLPDNVRRTIHTPMQLMMIEVAVGQDGGDQSDAAEAVTASYGGENLPPTRTSFTNQPVPVAPSTGSVSTDRSDQEDVMSQGDDAPPPVPEEASPATGSEPEEASPATWSEPEETHALEPREAHAPEASRPLSTSTGGDSPAHATHLAAAMERLAHRVTEADEALAAVASEVESFREAQRSFEAVEHGRERRRLELEAFRVDVARLAHEILGRVDGLFSAEDAQPAPSFGTSTDQETAPT